MRAGATIAVIPTMDGLMARVAQQLKRKDHFFVTALIDGWVSPMLVGAGANTRAFSEEYVSCSGIPVEH